MALLWDVPCAVTTCRVWMACIWKKLAALWNVGTMYGGLSTCQCSLLRRTIVKANLPFYTAIPVPE